MTAIHSTALVDSGAQLGEDVHVGPFAIIEAGARIGDRCIIGARAHIEGSVLLGPDNRIGPGAYLGGEPQDLSYKAGSTSEVHIGCGNTIREFVTIHRGTKEGTITRVGDRNFLMGGVHLAHNCQIGNDNILANNVLLAGYATFGNRIVVGGDVVFHQFIRVGDFAMVRGGTSWSKDIPPYVIGGGVNILAGLNAIGLKRNGFTPEERREITEAYRLVYRSGLNVRQALEKSSQRIWSPAASAFFAFLETPSKLGLCGARQRGQGLSSSDL